MCGRYQLGMEWDELQEHYRLTRELFDGLYTLPWYNQAPGQPSPALFRSDDGLEHKTVRWGYPPLWVARRGKNPWKERPLVNAKSEEARSKPTWSKSFRTRRCLVPTTGFYEWIRRDKDRFPLHFRPPGGGVLTLGGMWAAYKKGEEGTRICMAILTTGPNATMEPVHDRMPVILPRDAWEAWLDPETSEEEVDRLCAPAPAEALEVIEMNTSLNGWSSHGPEVLEANWTWEERPA